MMNQRRKTKSAPWPKAATGSPAAAAMGFRMKKPCAGFARRVKQTVERFAALTSAM